MWGLRQVEDVGEKSITKHAKMKCVKLEKDALVAAAIMDL